MHVDIILLIISLFLIEIHKCTNHFIAGSNNLKATNSALPLDLSPFLSAMGCILFMYIQHIQSSLHAYNDTTTNT